MPKPNYFPSFKSRKWEKKQRKRRENDWFEVVSCNLRNLPDSRLFISRERELFQISLQIDQRSSKERERERGRSSPLCDRPWIQIYEFLWGVFSWKFEGGSGNELFGEPRHGREDTEVQRKRNKLWAVRGKDSCWQTELPDSLLFVAFNYHFPLCGLSAVRVAFTFDLTIVDLRPALRNPPTEESS